MQDTQYPLISILIPTYNVEKYINKSISSILLQTYPNIEICVVDDGSSDGTVENLKRLEKTYTGDKKLNFAYAEHRGVGATRTELLYSAHGDYIFWMDSDDSISANTILNSYLLLIKENCDAVRIDFTTDYAGVVTMDNTAYMRLILMDRLKSYIVGTLFKKELWTGLKFDELSLVEDYEIYPKVAYRIKKVALIRATAYYKYVRNRDGSLTNMNQTKVTGLYPRMTHSEQRYNTFKGLYPNECQVILSQFANYACMLYFKSFTDSDLKMYASEAKNLIKNHKTELLACKEIPNFRKKELKAILYNNYLECFIFKKLHEAKEKSGKGK